MCTCRTCYTRLPSPKKHLILAGAGLIYQSLPLVLKIKVVTVKNSMHGSGGCSTGEPLSECSLKVTTITTATVLVGKVWSLGVGHAR